ncbi:MAG: HpcH/HpaI aldolase family protein [Pseudomonadales bacterium]
MRENAALKTWRAGGQTVGCWLSLSNPYAAEALSKLEFDWVCIDLQHGLLDYSDLTHLLPAISASDATPLVRVPWNEPYEIMKALDAGAYGIIVPMVNTQQEAAQAVAACRYPPDGNRSFGPIRAALYGGRGYAREANDHIATIVMIETMEGLNNVDEIVATPGLDAVYIGPSDLALALGLPAVGDTEHPTHAAAVTRILEACKRAGVAAGIHTSSVEYTRKYLAAGFNLVTLGSDAGFMMRAAATDLAAVRDSGAGEREKTGY